MSVNGQDGTNTAYCLVCWGQVDTKHELWLSTVPVCLLSVYHMWPDLPGLPPFICVLRAIKDWKWELLAKRLCCILYSLMLVGVYTSLSNSDNLHLELHVLPSPSPLPPPPSQTQYCIAVLVIVILEIVAGILGFVYRDAIVSCVGLLPSCSVAVTDRAPPLSPPNVGKSDIVSSAVWDRVL